MEKQCGRFRTAAKESFQQVFKNDNHVVTHLLDLINTYERDFRPLNLNGCRTNKNTLLTPINSSDKLSVQWNENYSAYSSSPSANDTHMYARYLPILHLQAHLVGYLDSDSNGNLRLSASCWTHKPLIVIAPPPGPEYRKCAVWCRDWRYVPPMENNLEGIFEVLRNDIAILTEDINSHNVSNQINSNRKRTDLENISGKIRAKSSIIASRSQSPSFFVELTCARDKNADIAATVVFHGRESIVYWPFVHIDSNVTITQLKVSTLPKQNNQRVLRVSGQRSQIYPGSCTTNGTSLNHSSRPRKVARFNTANSLTISKPIGTSNETTMKSFLITYEGYITGIEKDGRIELDGKVILHLGSQYDESAGITVASLCFRKGTLIRAHALFVFSQFSGQRILIPTARTVVDIVFFGPLQSKDDFPSCRIWNYTPWKSIWNHWSLPEIAWADELYHSLFQKFASWLLPNESTKRRTLSTHKFDKNIMEFFLGSRDSAGLVLYLMYLVTGRHFFVSFINSPRRDFFNEFLNTEHQLTANTRKKRIIVPTLHQITTCAGNLWTERVKRSYYEQGYSHSDTMGTKLESRFLFDSSEVVSQLLKDVHGRKPSNIKLQRLQLGLVGRLQSTENLSMVALSDATGDIDVRVIGSLKPHLIGAIVFTTEFNLVVHMLSSEQEPKIVGLINVSNIKVILDGEYSAVVRKSINQPNIESLNEIETIQQPGCSFVATLSQGIQRYDQHEVSKKDNSNKLFADVPVIAIFIYGVKLCNGKINVNGRIIAFKCKRSDPAWQSLESKNGGFWKCSLIISGEAGLEIAPILYAGELMSISCTELHKHKNINDYLFRKILKCYRERNDIQFFTHLTRLLPWVENLGNGAYLRFVTCESGMIDINDNEKGSGLDSNISDEGEIYMHISKALESFRKEIYNNTEKAIWELFEDNKNKCLDDFENVSFRGIITSVEECIEMNINSGNTVERIKVVLQENTLNLFSVTVNFYGEKNHANGLIVGLNVLMENVTKLAQEKGEGFLFIANETTVIRVMSILESGNTFNIKRNFERIVDIIPRKMIWNFFDDDEDNQLHNVGWIRNEWIQPVKLVINKLHDICNGICMQLESIIDDGTCQAILKCEGLKDCVKLLNMEENEIESMNKIIERNDRIKIEARMQINSNDEDYKVLEKMMKERRGNSKMIIVKDETRYKSKKIGKQVVINDMYMNQVGLGYRKKLWTAFTNDLTIELKCIAIFDELSRWRQKNEMISNTIELNQQDGIETCILLEQTISKQTFKK